MATNNAMTNSETEMCIWNAVCKDNLEAASLEELKSIVLSVRSSGSTFCRNSQRTKGRPCRSL